MLHRLTRRKKSRRKKWLKEQLASRVEGAMREKGWKDPLIRRIVREFHTLYYTASRRTWGNTYWRGVQVLKCPLDLWVYQEILHELRPDLSVEAGTKHGGSAYYLASICDLLGHGAVVTIDLDPLPGRPEHPRITYLTGSSISPEVVAKVDEQIGTFNPRGFLKRVA